MNRTSFFHRAAALLATAALTYGWLCAATAAEVKPPKPEPKAASSAPKSARGAASESALLETYRLKHADAESAARVMERIMAGDGNMGFISGPVKITIDPATSTLFVLASRSVQEKVADLVKKLDVPAEMRPSEQIKIFSLYYRDPESAAKVLKMIGPRDIRIATDDRTRTVIACGSPDSLNVAEALLTKLDDDSKNGEAVRSYEVRVVWLASGLTGEGAGTPPADDLKDVAAELSRQGIKDPRQVAQVAVQTVTGQSRSGQFQVKGSPRFGSQTADFSASGVLNTAPNGVLEMETAITTSSTPNHESNRIETHIVVPEKQYVVLATAPSGSYTSVFVVQVVRKTETARKQDKR